VEVVFGLPGDGINGIMESLRTDQDRVRFVQVKNDTLGMIKWEQMVFLGNPEFGCNLQPIDFALFAQAVGAAGYTIEDPADCGRVIEALAAPGPAVVQGIVDPFEPPLPGKITVDQATKFAQSLLRGEPNREKIAWTVLADRVREMV
jgi:pyruvate dehydrogenase (quinone)/pyruvate oxidase